MSDSIGYGAAAIRAGDVKYQQSLVDLMKQAAADKPANDAATADQPKPADSGHAVDVKV